MQAIQTSSSDPYRHQARTHVRQRVVDVVAVQNAIDQTWRYHVYVQCAQSALLERVHVERAEAETADDAIRAGFMAARLFLA